MDDRKIELYSEVRPALTAGAYEVELTQTITNGEPLGTIEPVTRHLEVTAPRFAMPGTEVLSVFPPPNAVGAFEDRLAQIALRRRTLPWDRSGPTGPPWLALVVLGEGECTYLSGVSLADAITPSALAALGASEAGTFDTIEVTSTVIKQVFPRIDELPLLAHVRHVDVSDTELAGSDEDGWVAVVMSNRLPRAGQRYGAYLISLEGQLGELPTSTAVQDEAGALGVYTHLGKEAIAKAGLDRLADAGPDLTASKQPVRTTASKAAAAPTDAWTLRGAAARVKPEATTATPAPAPVGVPVAAIRTSIDDLAHDVLLAVLDRPARRLRFPVLAHWSFTCDAGGDFETLMRNLDVGLLGTLPDPRPEAPPNAPPPRPVVTDSGHLAIAHTTRRGDPATAWYRGPLTPREVARRTDAGGFFAADQARRVATDGREDLSEAAAFEVGRLLALSDPRFIADLRTWARSGFVINRSRVEVAKVPGVAELRADVTLLGRTLGIALLDRLAAEDAVTLGRPVPPMDTADLLGDDDVKVIAQGLGLPGAVVADVLAPGLTQRAIDPGLLSGGLPTHFEELAEQPSLLASLSGGLDRTVWDMSRKATSPKHWEVVRLPDAEPLAPEPGRSLVEQLWPEEAGQ